MSELLYLGCNDIIAEAVEVPAKSDVPLSTPKVPLGSIPSVSAAAEAVFCEIVF